MTLFVLVPLVALSLGFVLVWWLASRLDNYSIVDVAWAWAFAPVVGWLAWTGPGWPPRRLVLAAVFVAWSVRLGGHLLQRVQHLHPREEGRYETLRQAWGDRLASRMFGFFQLQAVSVALLALPAFFLAAHASPAWSAIEGVALTVWVIGFLGVAQADRQLARFRADPTQRGRVCESGWWRYSRHPNYFFEACTWAGLGLWSCAAAPWGALGLLAPLIMLYLLLCVTGVPPTEAQALRSRGDAYRRYQQTVSVFVPAPRREPTSFSP